MSFLHPRRAQAAPPLASHEYPACIPPLPDGCSAHTIWSFRGEAGRFLYEFNLVYGPSTPAGSRGPIRRLDEGLSYWSVAWSEPAGPGEVRSMGRWLSFEQFRARTGSRVSFAQFSSLPEVRSELIGMLEPGEIRPPPAP